MLKLLISNDDGYQALGINVLADYLTSLGHKVTIVAPAGERSAQSHAMSFYHAVQVDKVSPSIYSVHGTPADCVAIALSAILKDDPPDFVLAGINNGLNVGIDVNYSGTVGAATEAAMMGYKAIAVSADTHLVRNQQDALQKLFHGAAVIVGSLLESHAKIFWPRFQVLNVNVPHTNKGVRVGECGGESLYVPNIEEIVPKRHPQTRLYYIGGTKRFEPNDMSQDVSLVSSGYTTLSFIQAKQSSHGFHASLQQFEANYDNTEHLDTRVVQGTHQTTTISKS